MRYNHITIEGNIGAGKTTLAKKISERLDTGLILESFSDNPFLPKFYEDPAQYAFPLEMFFLAERYQQLKNHFSNPDLFHPFSISDYFIDKSLIFSKNNLEGDEFELFKRLFNIMGNLLPKPELIIYLHVDLPALQENISKRGRSFEQKIPDDYLKSVEKGYFEYFKQNRDLRVVIVNVGELDLLNDEKDFEKVLEIMDADYEKGLKKVVL